MEPMWIFLLQEWSPYFYYYIVSWWSFVEGNVVLFSRVISKQTIIFLSHNIKTIIGLLVMFLISLSTISFNNSQIHISEVYSFLINRYFYSLELIPTLMLLSLSAIKYRKNVYLISQTRFVFMVKINIQTTLINFFLINGYF